MPHKENQNLSAFSVIIIFVLLSIIGIALLPRLNVSLSPSRTLPSITVRYSWHDASARTIESKVTSVLESMFNSMKSVRELESKTTKSSGNITIKFDEDVDMDAARFQVSSYIRRANAEFPEGVSYPRLSVNKPTEESGALLNYTIYGSASASHIQDYAVNNIKPPVANIDGVNKVAVYGATPFEWFITYKPELLETFNVTPQDIRKAINNHFGSQNLGYASLGESGGKKKNIRVKLRNRKAGKSVWEDIPVTKTGNRIIYLTDIAQVNHKEKKPNSYYRINGLNTINFVVYPEKRVNSLRLAEKVKEKMARAKTELPPSYSLRKMRDATEFIKEELQKVGIRAIIAVVVLLTFVLVISRRLKYLILITISLVVNLAIAVILYYAAGLEIHIYSLAGMTISLGIIIDNSIIMADHVRHQHNKKAFISILAATLTTVGALSLVFLLDQKQQLRLIDFSLIVIINLGVSLFVALFLIPSLLEKINLAPVRTKRFFRRKRKIVRITNSYARLIRLQVTYKWVFIVILILAFGTPIYMIPEKIEQDNFWAGIYNKTLGSKWYKNNLQGPANTYLGGTLRLFTEFVYESSFYSQPGKTKLYVRGEMPEGCTIQQLNEAVKKMEDYINRFDQIELYTTKISSYRNARITIFFKPAFETGFFPFKLKGKLIAKANNLGGMNWSIYGVGRGFSNAVHSGRKNSRIILYGYNYDKLHNYAENVKEHVKQHERVKEPQISGRAGWRAAPLRHKIVVDLNKKYLARMGFPSREVYSSLNRKTLQPQTIGQVLIGNELKNINLQAAYGQFDRWNLKNMPLENSDKTIKLKSAGSVERKKTGTDIYKSNQEYRLVVAFDFIGPRPLQEKAIEKFVTEANAGLPLGYRAETLSYAFRRGDSNKTWMLALIILIIFFICSILFESFRQPFVILSLIPLSFIGVFLTFYLFDINFDQGGFASFILLAGITVNAALYIINEYNNQLRRRGTNLKRYMKAFNHKVIPIVLTISSTILGLVPFLIGGQNEAFWFAFAAGSIGGMVFSLIGLFIFLPAFFLKKDRKK